MQLFAENKTVTLSDRLTTLIYSEEGKETILYRGKETGILEENKAFIESLRQNAEPPINHMDGLYATLMMLQAIKSVKSGKPEPIRSLIQRDQPVLS